jgi:prephenate dehydrogenase
VADRFARIAILGTGLIGGSLALALKRSKGGPQIRGFDLNNDSRRGAADLRAAAGGRAFDDVSGNLAETVREADLIVLATPVRAMELLLREIGPLARPGAVVTDTGGSKQQVLAWAETLLPESLQFVGGDPIAGKVSAGPWEADGGIFQNALFCLCPLPRTDRKAVDRLVRLVEEIGAVPYFVDAHEHDGLLAETSHLPYLASVALVNEVAEGRGWREAATLAAAPFATASHLSSSDPRIHLDLCLTNRDALLAQLDRFISELSAMREQIVAGDDSLLERLAQAQQHHRDWISGRATEEANAPPPADTSGLRPSSLFLPSGLMDRLRGKNRDRE